MSLKDRFANAWNAFRTESDRIVEDIENTNSVYQNLETSSYFRQDRYRMRYGNEHSILNSIYSRIANDIASIQIQHVRVDQNGRYVETINSGLNNCITLSANIDQTSRDFWMDFVLSMLDEGAVAGVAVDTDIDITKNNSFDVLSLRTGKILEWFPSRVRLEVYNDHSGNKEQITLPKDKVAIIENPFYSIMNEPNSTLKRLVYKMNLLDQIDGDKASSKLNMLVQLPYSLKSPTRIAQAEERKKVLEDQLANSKYGIAYIDSTEHITQLNRALENDLPQQIQELTNQLYDQIGFGVDVFKGTANGEQMLMYNKKVLKPILDSIELEFTRKFLTKTARTQGQKIGYYIDAFELVTPDEVANMTNALCRNEVVSSNEIRGVLGLKPDADPKSDELRNSNMPDTRPIMDTPNQNGSEEPSIDELDELESMLNDENIDTDSSLSETEKLLKQLEQELGS